MPVSRIFDHIPGVVAATWNICETEDGLIAHAHLMERDLSLYRSFNHPGRKKHWLACRALLATMFAPGKPVVIYNQYGKPCLENSDLHLSFSHSGDYAAAALSHLRVGIDIERITSRVERVTERFLSREEIGQLPQESTLEELWLRWCGKEALYKLYGNPETDFRNDIHIHPIKYLCNGGMEATGTILLHGQAVKCNLWFDNAGDYILAVALERADPETSVKMKAE